MKTKYFDSIPRYQQIALEVATRIVNGDYSEGDRISGRSSIASRYNVSPETARRAFCILADLEIISAEKGSGMHIKSKEKAASFLHMFSSQKDIESIQDELFSSIERQKAEMGRMNACLTELMKATEHYRSLNPLSPHAVRITSACRFLGRSIQDIQLWQHTGATLVAIRRGGELMLSPGPYAVLTENDVIFLIAQELSDEKVSSYLYSEGDSANP
jgi:K+/H+ antiporter YhaU regulatory subunit KhtT